MLKPVVFAAFLFSLGPAHGQAVPPGSMSAAVPAQSTVESAHLAWRSYNTGKPTLPDGYTDEAGARAAKLYAPPGYKIVGAQNDTASGFQAMAYQRTDGSGKALIAIRGSDEALNDLGRADVVGIGMREVVATSRIPLVNPVERMSGTSTPLVNPAAVLLNTSITAANAAISGAAGAAGDAAMSAQLKQAREFTGKIEQQVSPGSIAYTGHSLGGAIAQVESARTGYPAETFNAPGMKQTVERMCAEQTCRGQDGRQVVNHMREADRVGAVGEHVGRVNGYLNAGDDVRIAGPDGKPTGDSLYRSTGQTVLESIMTNIGNDAGLGQIIVDGLSAVLRREVTDNHNMQSFFVDLVDMRNRRRADFDVTNTRNETGAREQAAREQAARDAAAQSQPQALSPGLFPIPAGYIAPPMSTPAGPISVAPPMSRLPAPVAIASKTDSHPAPARAVCNKVYKTPDGCHPGHNEKSHPGGCRC